MHSGRYTLRWTHGAVTAVDMQRARKAAADISNTHIGRHSQLRTRKAADTAIGRHTAAEMKNTQLLSKPTGGRSKRRGDPNDSVIQTRRLACNRQGDGNDGAIQTTERSKRRDANDGAMRSTE